MTHSGEGGGGEGWHSGESQARLQPPCLRSKIGCIICGLRWRPVGSRPCLGGYFLDSPLFLSPQKPTLLNTFKFDQGSEGHKVVLLR